MHAFLNLISCDLRLFLLDKLVEFEPVKSDLIETELPGFCSRVLLERSTELKADRSSLVPGQMGHCRLTACGRGVT